MCRISLEMAVTCAAQSEINQTGIKRGKKICQKMHLNLSGLMADTWSDIFHCDTTCAETFGHLILSWTFLSQRERFKKTSPTFLPTPNPRWKKNQFLTLP